MTSLDVFIFVVHCKSYLDFCNSLDLQFESLEHHKLASGGTITRYSFFKNQTTSKVQLTSGGDSQQMHLVVNQCVCICPVGSVIFGEKVAYQSNEQFLSRTFTLLSFEGVRGRLSMSHSSKIHVSLLLSRNCLHLPNLSLS